jgi:hypothetical protein
LFYLSVFTWLPNTLSALGIFSCCITLPATFCAFQNTFSSLLDFDCSAPQHQALANTNQHLGHS